MVVAELIISITGNALCSILLYMVKRKRKNTSRKEIEATTN